MLFEDVVDVPINAIVTEQPIDDVFLKVCGPGTIQSVSAVPNHPIMVGAQVIRDRLRIEVDPPEKLRHDLHVIVKLSGRQKGDKTGVRFGRYTREQMERNRDFWKRAHSDGGS
jgi:hypothetical protein